MSLFRTMGRGESRDNGFTRWLEASSSPSAAGVNVTQDTALRLPVVYRCVALNSETIGALPVDTLRRVGAVRMETTPPVWVDSPNDEQTWQEFITMAQLSLELDGNGFLLKASTPAGKLAALYVMAPSAVTVKRELVAGKRSTLYEVAQTSGPPKVLGANEVVHIRGLTMPGATRGISPITLLRESIGVGLASQEYAARWFGEGAHLSGVIETPGAPMKQEDADRLQEQFQRKHGGIRKSHALGILSGGAKFTPMSVNAEESQFLETQRVTATQISLAFGVPPNYSTDAEGTKGYVTGVAAGKLMWLQAGLLTRITRLEHAFSALMPAGQYLKFNLRGFLRGSPDEESAYLSAQLDRGVITVNEWRELIDRNPVQGGDVALNTLANFTQV